MLADALLRSVAGASALLRVTGTNTETPCPKWDWSRQILCRSS